MTEQGLTLESIVVDSPSEAETSSEKHIKVIADSSHESEFETVKTNEKITGRKLFRQHSGIMSLSPVEVQLSPVLPIKLQKKSKRLNSKYQRRLRDRSIVSRETTMNSTNQSKPKDSIKNNISQSSNTSNDKNDIANKISQGSSALSDQQQEDEPDDSDSESSQNSKLTNKIKKKTKTRKKIVSKKIVINKKLPGLELMENLRQNFNSNESIVAKADLNSDFCMAKKTKQKKKEFKKLKRMVIVATGFSKGDKALIKSVINTLGSAILEEYVTKYTTHVVGTGVRTINLLKAIIRGCWLVNMDWVLSSLEKKAWEDPAKYEMDHYSKAVKSNRKNRQSFGSAYVPDLFISCGSVYVENGTSPPARVLKELIKTAGGEITEDIKRAKIVVGSQGVKEGWVLDSITSGEIQPIKDYARKGNII